MKVESYDRFILLRNNRGDEVARLTVDDAWELIEQIKGELERVQACECGRHQQQTNY